MVDSSAELHVLCSRNITLYPLYIFSACTCLFRFLFLTFSQVLNKSITSFSLLPDKDFYSKLLARQVQDLISCRSISHSIVQYMRKFQWMQVHLNVFFNHINISVYFVHFPIQDYILDTINNVFRQYRVHCNLVSLLFHYGSSALSHSPQHQPHHIFYISSCLSILLSPLHPIFVTLL